MISPPLACTMTLYFPSLSHGVLDSTEGSFPKYPIALSLLAYQQVFRGLKLFLSHPLLLFRPFPLNHSTISHSTSNYFRFLLSLFLNCQMNLIDFCHLSRKHCQSWGLAWGSFHPSSFEFLSSSPLSWKPCEGKSSKILHTLPALQFFRHPKYYHFPQVGSNHFSSILIFHVQRFPVFSWEKYFQQSYYYFSLKSQALVWKSLPPGSCNCWLLLITFQPHQSTFYLNLHIKSTQIELLHIFLRWPHFIGHLVLFPSHF